VIILEIRPQKQSRKNDNQLIISYI